MRKSDGSINRPVNRRSFLKTGMLAGSAATVGAGLVGSLKPAFGQSSSLTKGDVAILRMLAAAELIEADLWTQYAELGGTSSKAAPACTRLWARKPPVCSSLRSSSASAETKLP